ncbi:hypothetical protein KP509_12G085000 [Ceratopteris richardii]|uniref:Glutathione synthetase n=1 Tax=Ceratopteris richardii TaxID=49495 RepID=A0A8T2TRF0_CERRI|nr:hypothetical protein KP509_12G085000 [Ceratopteris richardii]
MSYTDIVLDDGSSMMYVFGFVGLLGNSKTLIYHVLHFFKFFLTCYFFCLEEGGKLYLLMHRTKGADRFTARLLDIHSLILQEGIKQEIYLGLHRSDYMADLRTGNLLQVEINTISSSFAGLGSRVTGLHRYMVNCIGQRSDLDSKAIPENEAADGFAKAIATAFKEWGNPQAVVLMVVQPGERNMYDQYWLSTKLQEKYGIHVIRRTLAEVYKSAKLHEDNTFSIGKHTIAVVYYRAGYDPKDYPSEDEWSARTLMEKSNAIKCPSISYHLAGTKKIQQELAKPGVLERFVKKADDAEKLRRCFAGLWGFDNNEELQVIEDAIANPDDFVLKPQREGGGNNIYGENIKSKLEELKEGKTADSFDAYILMQRIFPPIHTTYFVRNGEPITQKSVSELGIFSTFVRKNNEVIVNEQVGYLLRTKASDTNEGGVATGFAVLDSVYLIED